MKKEYTCKFCGYTTDDRKMIRLHARTIHELKCTRKQDRAIPGQRSAYESEVSASYTAKWKK
jgi:hypothetical protein